MRSTEAGFNTHQKHLRAKEPIGAPYTAAISLSQYGLKLATEIRFAFDRVMRNPDLQYLASEFPFDMTEAVSQEVASELINFVCDSRLPIRDLSPAKVQLLCHFSRAAMQTLESAAAASQRGCIRRVALEEVSTNLILRGSPNTLLPMSLNALGHVEALEMHMRENINGLQSIAHICRDTLRSVFVTCPQVSGPWVLEVHSNVIWVDFSPTGVRPEVVLFVRDGNVEKAEFPKPPVFAVPIQAPWPGQFGGAPKPLEIRHDTSDPKPINVA